MSKTSKSTKPDPWADRWAVMFRRGPKDPWRALVSCGSREQATALMDDLQLARGGGDWYIAGPPPTPPISLPDSTQPQPGPGAGA